MERLKQLRKSKNLYQRDVAEYLGLERTTYVKYETGASMPSMDILLRLSDLYGVSIDYLLGRVHDQNYTAPTLSAANVTFPVIGDIAAGYDRLALDGWEDDTVEIPLSYLKGRPQSDFFVLRVKGDSMFPTYADGDRVLILKQDPNFVEIDD